MCFHFGSQSHRRDRSPSPPPRPVRRRRHSPELSDPVSSSTRRRRRQQAPEVVRHHARRSTQLVFEGESSSTQTPNPRRRKQSDEARVKSRSRRRRPAGRIRNWAADIPEDVEDPDPPVAALTRRQGKQPESRAKDPIAGGETKEQEYQVGKPPMGSESPAETKKTPENEKAESSKTAVDTKEQQASKPSMETKTPTGSPEKIILESSKAGGQTDAQKAAAARKLPKVENRASGVNEMNPPPVPDPSVSTTSASAAPISETKKATADTAEHGKTSSVAGFSSGNKDKGIKSQSKKGDDADAVSVSSKQKPKGLFGEKK